MSKVSIVIPCYNHGEFLMETLDSVQAQTFGDYEIIIVNDGSTDPLTIELLHKLDRPKTKVIHTGNQGVSAARNRAIAEALGDYILPLDADDKIAPTYLEKAAAVLDSRPEVGVVFGERLIFGEQEGGASLPHYDPQRILVENLIYPAAMFRKKHWAKVGGYNEAMLYGWEDWDFWVAMSRLQGAVVKLPEVMFYYRVRSTSRDHSLRFLHKVQMFWLMVRRNRKLYYKHLAYVFFALSRIIISDKTKVGRGGLRAGDRE